MNNRCLLHVLLLLSLILAPGVALAASGLIAQVEQTRIAANETLILRVIAQGKTTGEPDLSPLEADFEVLNRSTSTRTTVVNGDMSQMREWVLELAPRREGDLTVPSLTLGGERSQPVKISVVEVSAAADGGPRPLFMETQVDSSSPYVQQAFGYRVRILYREQPRRAVLSDPQAEGATLVQRGDDRTYSETIGDQPYTVIERRFLVVPQRSGPLTIRSPRLEALLPDNRPGAHRSPFGDLDQILGGRVFQGFPTLPDLSQGRRVNERGPDRTVQVRPQPDGAPNPWLPAQSVQLADEWIPSPPGFRVGEPITRVLSITARGATAAQLPTLEHGMPDGLSVYPEQPQTEDLPDGDVPAALKIRRIALVPTRPGPLTLPEIRLPWWDTQADESRVAVIPARTVEVLPGAAQARDPGVVPAPSALSRPEVSATPGEPALPAVPARGMWSLFGLDLAGGAPWPLIALVLGIGWVLTLLWLARVRRAQRRTLESLAGTATAAPQIAQSLGALREEVRRACHSGDPRTLREALLAWGRARWPAAPPAGLSALASGLGGADTVALFQGIDRAIYAPSPEAHRIALEADVLWQRLAPLLDAAGGEGTRQGAQGPLPGLYPRGV